MMYGRGGAVSLVKAGSSLFFFPVLLALLLAACRPDAPAPVAKGLRVLAAETFLADIAQNVAGDRIKVEALIPVGIDPHSFEPTPADVRKVAESDVVIVSGAGFEGFLERLLQNAGGKRQIIEASQGLVSREPDAFGPEGKDKRGHETDPHFWLDPTLVIRYVENIRDGLAQADPEGAGIYARNAKAYIAQLEELDRWIAQQVAQIPPERRLLVTNHESLGYFADRYRLHVIGSILASVTTGASPSAQEMTHLAESIRQTGAPAIFLETGSNPRLADQLARETGTRVVAGLLTHSVTGPEGPAPDYLGMMRYNTQAIVNALK